MASEHAYAHRRKHTRYPFILRAEYSDGNEFFGEWTENLSAGGLFVRTERTFAVDDAIQVSLSFPGLLDPIDVDGRVAWVRESSPIQPGGVGVEVSTVGARRLLAELAMRAALADRLDVSRPITILVVEDNPRVVRSYHRVLKHLSPVAAGRIEIDYCTNGRSALAKLKRRAVDLIVTDIYMPVMDGFTLIERIREDPNLPDIPVIVITGGRADEQQRAESIGVHAFLHKPVQFAEILETIIWLAGRVAETDARSAIEAALAETDPSDDGLDA